MHGICRTWCEIDKRLAPQDDSCDSDGLNTLCCLCSQTATPVVKCAAENCSVRFHPMCAVIASVGAEITYKRNLAESGAEESDAYLCTQYTLSLAQTSFSDGEKSLVDDATTLPVAFCSYHNPKRHHEFYGLYPGACFLDGSVRIPPKRV